MKKITNWMIHHQLTAFFLITFGITFGLGFSFEAVMNRKVVLLALSTLVFLANNIIVNHAPVSPVLVIFVSVVAIPVAYVLSQVFSRVPNVSKLLSSLVKIRGAWGWLLLGLLLPAGLNVLSIVISNLLGRQSVQFSDLHDTNFTLVKMVTVTLFYQLFFYNLTGEEIGWRGFALPRLQSRLSPLIASLVLTFFWAAWHALYWKAAGEPVFSAQYWGETLIRLFPATVMINWFYNRSKGSILVAGIVHVSANTAFAFMPRVDWPVHTVMMYIFVGGLVLISRMWEKLPIGHGAVVQITQEDPVLPGRIPAVMRNDGER